jgi:hypothetical protein
MKGKKTTIRAKAPKKRNPVARALNQKAQVMAEGPKRLGTRRAREKRDIQDNL